MCRYYDFSFVLLSFFHTPFTSFLMAGIYIHIPFCKSRCIYCGFYSSTLLELRQRYVDALCREMQLRAHELHTQQTETIYLGGGTPSMLSGKQLQQIFAHLYNIYKVKPDAEVTIECNPDDVTSQYADMLAPLPVNRVSMGAQTFDDQRLRLLGRRHNARQVDEAMQHLRAVGIGNISIDLMFGFPGQSLQQWADDISHALSLRPEHLAAYALTYEEGTPLHRRSQSDPRFAPISDQLSLAMYHQLIDSLQSAGYEHYEISNFSHQGFHSRHNSNYWNQTPYIGLGAAAHSYDGASCRRWNIDDVKKYIEGIENRRPDFEQEVLDADTRYNDLVMTALRTRKGLDLSLLSPEQVNYCKTQALRYEKDGLLVFEDQHLRLTRRGLFVSNMIMSDLMKV